MDKRRVYKSKTEQYKNIQRDIRKKIRVAKEKEKTEKCEEIEIC